MTRLHLPRSTRSLFLVLLLAAPALAAAPPAPKAPALPKGATVERDIEYTRKGGKFNSLDLYLPPKADHEFPLVIWIHGERGAKETCPAIPLLAKGFAVASINYRLPVEAKFPAQIQDAKAAVRFLRANAGKYNLDSDKFAAWGSASGERLASLLGAAADVKELEGDADNATVSSAVQAVADWAAAPPHPDDTDKAAKAPAKYVKKGAPPFLIMEEQTGGFLQPIGNSKALHDALSRVGGRVQVEAVAKPADPDSVAPETMKIIHDFLAKYLHVTADPPKPK